jgi:hypothetical protein
MKARIVHNGREVMAKVSAIVQVTPTEWAGVAKVHGRPRLVVGLSQPTKRPVVWNVGR